jgi:hypothetical protein
MKKILLLLLVILFAGCVDQSKPMIFLEQDLNVSDLNLFSDLDGGFANSVYLPVQHIDGGAAT